MMIALSLNSTLKRIMDLLVEIYGLHCEDLSFVIDGVLGYVHVCSMGNLFS